MFSLWTYIFDVHIILTFKSYYGFQSLHYHNGGRVTTIISNICRKKTPFLLGMGEGGTQINFDTFFRSAKVSQLACTRRPPCQNWIDTFCKSCPNCVQVGVGPLLKLILKLFIGETSCPICGQEGGGVRGVIWAMPERKGLFLGFFPLHMQRLSVPWTICSSRKNFVCDISESETDQCSSNAKVTIYKCNAEMKMSIQSV